MGFLPKINPRTDDQRQADFDRRLIQIEAEIGGKLFGPVPEGRERQFFCLDEHTWVWHETWTNAKGHRQSITTRYDVRPSGVIKLQDGQVYQRLSREEASNLYQATQIYTQKVSEVYQRMLATA